MAMKKSTPKPFKSAVKPATTYTKKYFPVSDEITNYGAKKFRTPYRENEYKGLQGSAQKAVVLDIDGTLQSFGSSAIKSTLDWAKKHYDKDHVLLVVTARDHEYMFDASFNWVMHSLPFPFIGPFCRAKDDPRYASEFKRELVQGFEDMGLYKIVGAADDNYEVNAMWAQWAIEHFDDPADFDHLKCWERSYDYWREGLPNKGYTSTKSDWKGNSYYGNKSTISSAGHEGEEWVNGHRDDKGNWIAGGWVKKSSDKFDKLVEATRSNADALADLVKKIADTHITSDPGWQAYFAKREAKGAYLGVERSDEEALWDEVVDAADNEVEGYVMLRKSMLDIVRREYPGYTEDELRAMKDDELRDLVRDVSIDSTWTDDDVPLFSHGGLPPGETEETRATRLNARLDLEEDVYAEYCLLSMEEITEMDIVDLDQLMDAAETIKEMKKQLGDHVEPALARQVIQDTFEEAVSRAGGEESKVGLILTEHQTYLVPHEPKKKRTTKVITKQLPPLKEALGIEDPKIATGQLVAGSAAQGVS